MTVRLWGKTNPALLLVRVKASMEVPYKPGDRSSMCFNYTSLGLMPKGLTHHRDTCMPMFIATLSTIARNWSQPRCPSTDEWIENMSCI